MHVEGASPLHQRGGISRKTKDSTKGVLEDIRRFEGEIPQ